MPAVVTIAMKEAVRIGLAVTSHAGPFITATAKMSEVETEGDISPAGEFIMSDDMGFHIITLPLGGGSLYPQPQE